MRDVLSQAAGAHANAAASSSILVASIMGQADGFGKKRRALASEASTSVKSDLFAAAVQPSRSALPASVASPSQPSR
jgi:hypothetical protein